MKLIWFVFTAHFWACLAADVSAQESDPLDRDCIPASEIEQSSGDESGPSQEGEDKPELPTCEELDAELAGDAEAASEPDPNPQDEEQAPDAEENDPEQEFEVDPEDEISEDYPVPLPSDI